MNVTVNFTDYFNIEVTLNATEAVDTVDQEFAIGIYSVLFIIGAVGNVAMFVFMIRSRRRKSRVNLLMTHLVVADLIVTFIVIPLEIGWRSTNAWLAGNWACKFFLVLRAFGLYLSSNVLVCISLDRFYAVVYPLRSAIVKKRSKIMLSIAWTVALLCSAPQSLVFRVMNHPAKPEFRQCVSFDAFSNQQQELIYNLASLLAMYFIPLVIITICYGCIFLKISKKAKEISGKCMQPDQGRIQLRRSDQRLLTRARRRTLRMTVTIVTVFACCWLPYATMTLWYMFDRKSAVHVSARVQDLFFIMAVSNSCMDPLVYGSFKLEIDIVQFILKKASCFHGTTGTVRDTTLRSRRSQRFIKAKKVQTITLPCTRYQETSLNVPSGGSSDPIPLQCWSERNKTYDIFTLQSDRCCKIYK